MRPLPQQQRAGVSRFPFHPYKRRHCTTTRKMDGATKVAACILWSSVLLLIFQLISLTEGLEYQALRNNNRKCMFQDKDTCKRAERNQCEWCELPQECYHKETVKQLGASCNGSQRRQLKEVQDCADISDKENCLSFDHCRWCKSKTVDDGCFRAWEARRLPIQIFDCRKEIQ